MLGPNDVDVEVVHCANQSSHDWHVTGKQAVLGGGEILDLLALDPEDMAELLTQILVADGAIEENPIFAWRGGVMPDGRAISLPLRACPLYGEKGIDVADLHGDGLCPKCGGRTE